MNKRHPIHEGQTLSVSAPKQAPLYTQGYLKKFTEQVDRMGEMGLLAIAGNRVKEDITRSLELLKETFLFCAGETIPSMEGFLVVVPHKLVPQNEQLAILQRHRRGFRFDWHLENKLGNCRFLPDEDSENSTPEPYVITNIRREFIQADTPERIDACFKRLYEKNRRPLSLLELISYLIHYDPSPNIQVTNKSELECKPTIFLTAFVLDGDMPWKSRIHFDVQGKKISARSDSELLNSPKYEFAMYSCDSEGISI